MAKKDEVKAIQNNADGSVTFVRHQHEDGGENCKVSTGVMRQAKPEDVLEDGEQSFMNLGPADTEGWQEVKHEVVGKNNRPSKVNSKAYRDNWTGIFGEKQLVGKA